MSDPNTHLKLDRLLAGQDRIVERIKEQDETISALQAAIEMLSDATATQTEVINRLSEALSKEPEGGSDLAASLKSIATSLEQIKKDNSGVQVMLGRLAPMVAQAAQDAVIMAMGGGVDIPPKDDEE